MTTEKKQIDFKDLLEEKRKKLIEELKFEGLTVRFVDRSEFRKLIDYNYSRVFGSSMTNYTPTEAEIDRATPIWTQYQNLHTDYLILSNTKGDYVGHFSGETEDHNTFYLRNAGILPDWRKKKIASRFVDAYLKYLHNLGYSRVTSQHHGTNNAVLIMMLKLGFHICGVETREEWGVLVKCVKLLAPDREPIFKSVTMGNR
ncbi:MAG TPA: GNAT family N-acetyltransferase, partial [Pseudobdellovibrionaceae bacterium]|nr:GNAT family N-acetyltransferase [Pseudobdellovibrionaceae bacterium]